MIDRIYYNRVSMDQLETIDNEIPYILEKARKKMEGPARGIPYSKAKLKAYSALKY